ncbi:hypothetical protein NTE_00501 [Candidatus Nitrososphaera evergladensis SR1]|uniref:Uncharacterized protein n=1 Tax=Candidatus Nitrososphaera evergladensis SR1 TaxID=1459636 RepID=A0A075MP60_9ARCH|nr:hypothetical protein [Candidatus Nitrososphaera evergladensis]AIF82582.1 hypothetical protein NTE_00501 [Candidatus Nitrososphaera evergladensis SR1]
MKVRVNVNIDRLVIEGLEGGVTAAGLESSINAELARLIEHEYHVHQDSGQEEAGNAGASGLFKKKIARGGDFNVTDGGSFELSSRTSRSLGPDIARSIYSSIQKAV